MGGRNNEDKEGAKQILRGALRIGATATLGLKAGDVAEEMWKEINRLELTKFISSDK